MARIAVQSKRCSQPGFQQQKTDLDGLDRSRAICLRYGRNVLRKHTIYDVERGNQISVRSAKFPLDNFGIGATPSLIPGWA